MDRITTGIDGLDAQLNGGFPPGTVNLVSGSAGCGKTIFCTQFLWAGLENGEKCLYISTEQEPSTILEDAAELGMEFIDHNDSFEIMFINPFQHSEEFVSYVEEKINNFDADRIVIDSTSTLGMDQKITAIRERLYNLFTFLRDESRTILVTAEIPEEGAGLSRYGVEDFVSDGVIVLRGFGLGNQTYRSLQIVKMRRTQIDGDVLSMDITADGITVDPEETF